MIEVPHRFSVLARRQRRTVATISQLCEGFDPQVEFGLAVALRYLLSLCPRRQGLLKRLRQTSSVEALHVVGG